MGIWIVWRSLSFIFSETLFILKVAVEFFHIQLF